MQYGNAETKAKHYLIIGPWDHPGTRTPKKEVGGLTFGDASLLDMNDLHRQWYDWTMKNGPEARVSQEARGLLRGRAGSGELEVRRRSRCHRHRTPQAVPDLAGRVRPNDVFHSGQMVDQPPWSAPDKFVYDPSDLRPAEIEKDDIAKPCTDERYALNLFGNGVVYPRAPFPEATEISGNVKLTIWMAMDVPDTDFGVTLRNPARRQRRAIERRWNARPLSRVTAQIQAGNARAITRIRFDGFTWFSRRVSKGGRLRLVLSCNNSIYVEKNLQRRRRVESEWARTRAWPT